MNFHPIIITATLALLASVSADGADITYSGVDTTTSGRWRTTSVSKPLDGDSNNLYGTDGYLLTGATDFLVNPAYATVSRLSSATFPGNAAYTIVDNPQAAGTRTTGLWYSTGAVTDQQQDLALITITVARSFRLGILSDNTDFADISPNNLRVYQVSGGSANSGLIASYIEPNNDSDWYFFDIVNALPGDTFRIAGTNTRLGSGPQDSNGIGGVTFDTIPEPSTALLGVIGILGVVGRRIRAGRKA